MSFSGTLNAIPLIDVVQLVGLTRRTGTLTIVNGRGRFALAFRDGCVVGASAARLPSYEGAGGSQTPTGAHASNVKTAQTDADLRLVASKIVNLRGGHFSFQPGDSPLESGVSVEVSSLTLDSCRQHDEDVRDGLAQREPDACEEDEAAGANAPPALDDSEPPAVSLYELFRLLPSDPCPADISWLFLQTASKVFERAILFLVTENALEGVGGFSTHGRAEPGRLSAALALVRIPRHLPSVLDDSVEMTLMGAGRADADWWSRYIPAEFGPAPTEGYVAVPVTGSDGCSLILYGDTFTRRAFENDLRALEMLGRHAGVLLENHRLRRKSAAAAALDQSHLASALRGAQARAV